MPNGEDRFGRDRRCTLRQAACRESMLTAGTTDEPAGPTEVGSPVGVLPFVWRPDCPNFRPLVKAEFPAVNQALKSFAPARRLHDTRHLQNLHS